MFNLNSIPVVGWFLDISVKASLALPFWLSWTVFGLGEKYFYFLPKVYHEPGFWNCVGIFIVIPILYRIFIPTIVSVSQTNNNSQNNNNPNEDEEKE